MAKILRKLISKSSDNFFVFNKTLLDFKKKSEGKLQLMLTDDFESMVTETDFLLIVEDYENQNEKQIPYYKTIVDGLLSYDK